VYLHDTGWPGQWYVPAIGATIVFLCEAYLVRVGFRRWRQRTLMQDTPIKNAQSLSVGLSELSGTAVPADEPVSAPFSDDCVVAECDTSGDNDTWDTVDSGALFRPFHVEDSTERVLVRPHEETHTTWNPGTNRLSSSGATGRVPRPSSGSSGTPTGSSSRPIPTWRSTSSATTPRTGRPPTATGGDRETQTEADSTSDSNWEAGQTQTGGDISASDGDRKYRQSLIETGEEVYVFGTARPRDRKDVPSDASNADRLVIEKITDGSMQEPIFMISDDEEHDLVDCRRWVLRRLPTGWVFLTVGFATLPLTLVPVLGLEVPRVFDGLVGGVS
jgi:hypothetical protein